MSSVWNYDPISRGLKHQFRIEFPVFSHFVVWNYDPISRGLKHFKELLSFDVREFTAFGTMTRFLGD